MDLLRISKELSVMNETSKAGSIERLYAEKGDDGVYHTRYRYRVKVRKLEDDDIKVECMVNNTFHNDHGPAIYVIGDTGVQDEQYCLTSGRMTYEEWKKHRDPLKSQPYDDILEELLAEMGI